MGQSGSATKSHYFITDASDEEKYPYHVVLFQFLQWNAMLIKPLYLEHTTDIELHLEKTSPSYPHGGGLLAIVHEFMHNHLQSKDPIRLP